LFLLALNILTIIPLFTLVLLFPDLLNEILSAVIQNIKHLLSSLIDELVFEV